MHVIFLGSPPRFMILYMRIGKLRLTHSTFGALKRSKVSWRHKKAPTLQLCVGARTFEPKSSVPGPFFSVSGALARVPLIRGPGAGARSKIRGSGAELRGFGSGWMFSCQGSQVLDLSLADGPGQRKGLCQDSFGVMGPRCTATVTREFAPGHGSRHRDPPAPGTVGQP